MYTCFFARRGKQTGVGDALVAVLADDEPAVLPATLVDERGVLLLAHLRRRRRRKEGRKEDRAWFSGASSDVGRKVRGMKGEG